MSTFTLCFPCEVPIKIPEALKSVIRQDDDGAVYLNIYFNQRNNCDLYSLAYDCLALPPLEGMIKDLIVQDECGHCALNVLVNICDVCDEDIQIM